MQRKNITENKEGDSEVIGLIVALSTHPNCPEYLRDDIWDSLNDNSDIDGNDPDQLRLMWKYRYSAERGKSNLEKEVAILEKAAELRRRK